MRLVLIALAILLMPASAVAHGHRHHGHGAPLGRKRARQRPAAPQPLSDGSASQPSNLCSFRYWHLAALKLNKAIAAPVATLASFGRPSTIVGLIISIVVRKPIERMLRSWSQPHVCKKDGERRLPSIANPDSTPAVIRVLEMVWVAAAIFHTGPCNIFWGIGKAVRFAHLATTGKRVAPPNIWRDRYCFASTVTPKSPSRGVVAVSIDKLYRRQKAVLLACCHRWRFCDRDATSLSHGLLLAWVRLGRCANTASEPLRFIAKSVAVCTLFSPAIAEAKSHHHGVPWCGIYMMQRTGIHGPGNLARAIEWAHVGQPASGPGPGIIGVLAHHVFQVVSVLGAGRVMAISGNDSNAVRTRPRSTAGVIAWRRV